MTPPPSIPASAPLPPPLPHPLPHPLSHPLPRTTTSSLPPSASERERLEEVLSLYASDRLLDASRLLRALTSTASPALLSSLASSPAVASMRRDIAEVDATYAALDSTGPEWETCYESSGTKVDYRAEGDKVSHTMRATGVIRAPLRNVAVLLNEPDLFPELFWFVTNSKLVGTSGRFRRGADITTYAPPPLADRDVSLFGYAVDALDNDDVVLCACRDRRAEDEAAFEGGSTDSSSGGGGGDVEQPTLRSRLSFRDNVQAAVHYSMFELRPVSPDVTKVRLICNSDPRLSYVPTIIINWSSRVIMRFALRVIEARARNMDGLPRHAERLKKDSVYAWMDERLMSYWKSKGFSEDEVLNAELDEAGSEDEFDAAYIPSPPSKSSLIALLTPSSPSAGSAMGGFRRMLSRGS